MIFDKTEEDNQAPKGKGCCRSSIIQTHGAMLANILQLHQHKYRQHQQHEFVASAFVWLNCLVELTGKKPLRDKRKGIYVIYEHAYLMMFQICLMQKKPFQNNELMLFSIQILCISWHPRHNYMIALKQQWRYWNHSLVL